MNITEVDFIHPEIQSGEIFFTNSSQVKFEKIQFSTKRRGKVAYDGRGNLTSNINWFPVFIQEEELKNKNLDLREIRRAFREIR